MQLEITTRKPNPLLDRTDVHFRAVHDGEKTPARSTVRDQLANSLGVKKELVVVDHMESDWGRGMTTGYAKVYASVEKARYHERDYLLKRNDLFVEKPKKTPPAGTEEKKEAPKARKPKGA